MAEMLQRENLPVRPLKAGEKPNGLPVHKAEWERWRAKRQGVRSKVGQRGGWGVSNGQKASVLQGRGRMPSNTGGLSRH